MRYTHTRFIISTASAFGVLALAGAFTIPNAAGLNSAALASPISNATPPSEIVLTGIARDFREKSVEGGHPDFESVPDWGFGHYSGNIKTTLSDDGKPVWIGGGRQVNTQWKDKSGRPIAYSLYEASAGDVAGTWGELSAGGVKSAATFDQWFSDVPGVNASMPLAVRLVRSADGSYVFDDKLDPEYTSRGGFFPLDDQLLGNSAGVHKHNYHFTFELHTEFTYDASAKQVFKFVGDDDVFVFINGKLVIDMGGVHSAIEQHVDLNRLGLTDGEVYRLDFFFAERHRTQSNFRIQTNLLLSTPDSTPTINSSFD